MTAVAGAGAQAQSASASPSALAAYDAILTGYAEDVGRPVARLELPRPRTTLILALGAELRLRPAGGAERALWRAFVTGLGNGPTLARHEGRFACIEVDLAPWAAPALFGSPTASVREPLDLIQLWGSDAERLAESLTEAGSWEARFHIIAVELARRLGAPRRTVRPEIRWAWRRMEACRGNLRMRDLADEIGWSGRHFALTFAAELGIAPKAAARHLRLQHVLDLMARSTEGLAGIATAAGYSDQSHMTRDFASLAGCTPLAWRSADLPGLPGKPAGLLQG